MGKTILAAVVAVAVCAVVFWLAIGNRYRLVEVQSGKTVECLGREHVGNPVMRSSVKTLRVAKKDAGNYDIAVDSLVCDKCQARAETEAREAAARKQKEDLFIASLQKHDDAVLLCCRRIAGISAADPLGVARSLKRDMKRLRTLALSGKQLSAPQSLAQVEYKYGKSMDELLAAIPFMHKGVRDIDMDAMQSAKLHMLVSKQYRDEAILGIEGR